LIVAEVVGDNYISSFLRRSTDSDCWRGGGLKKFSIDNGNKNIPVVRRFFEQRGEGRSLPLYYIYV
jgi:hypothetical protein